MYNTIKIFIIASFLIFSFIFLDNQVQAAYTYIPVPPAPSTYAFARENNWTLDENNIITFLTAAIVEQLYSQNSLAIQQTYFKMYYKDVQALWLGDGIDYNVETAQDCIDYVAAKTSNDLTQINNNIGFELSTGQASTIVQASLLNAKALNNVCNAYRANINYLSRYGFGE